LSKRESFKGGGQKGGLGGRNGPRLGSCNATLRVGGEVAQPKKTGERKKITGGGGGEKEGRVNQKK